MNHHLAAALTRAHVVDVYRSAREGAITRSVNASEIARRRRIAGRHRYSTPIVRDNQMPTAPEQFDPDVW